MLTLSGPVEFFLCFIATWTCGVVSVMLVVCSLSVFLSMCPVCFVWFMFDCVGECFASCVGEVRFSLEIMCCICVVLVFCWVVRVLSYKEYVCCVCDPSVCLGVPSICPIVCLSEGCDFRVEL